MAGRLIHSVIGSLDGYYADAAGRFDWAMPDEEVLAHVNEVEQGVSTYLYGRRIYEMMTVWENDPEAAAQSEQSGEFARVWTRAEKHVYSTTLTEVSTERTTLHRTFDVEEVRAIKAAAPADLDVAGPTLAQHAFAAGLVDEIQVVVVPVVIGGGLSYHPTTPVDLALLDTRRFGNGMVWLRYDVTGRR
jgi:dihydrofolate reductase